MDFLQLINWPLRLAYVFVIRPLVRAVSGNPSWPDEPTDTENVGK